MKETLLISVRLKSLLLVKVFSKWLTFDSINKDSVFKYRLFDVAGKDGSEDIALFLLESIGMPYYWGRNDVLMNMTKHNWESAVLKYVDSRYMSPSQYCGLLQYAAFFGSTNLFMEIYKRQPTKLNRSIVDLLHLKRFDIAAFVIENQAYHKEGWEEVWKERVTSFYSALRSLFSFDPLSIDEEGLLKCLEAALKNDDFTPNNMDFETIIRMKRYGKGIGYPMSDKICDLLRENNRIPKSLNIDQIERLLVSDRAYSIYKYLLFNNGLKTRKLNRMAHSLYYEWEVGNSVKVYIACGHVFSEDIRKRIKEYVG